MIETIYGKIINVDVKENGNVYVKIVVDGNVIGEGERSGEQQKGVLNLPSINQNEIKYKSMKMGQNSPSMVKASYNYSSLIGSSVNRIVSSEKHGNFILGSTTFTSHPENIRISGVYRLNGLLTSTMPSTIVTPIPMLVFDFPLTQAVSSVKTMLESYNEMISSVVL